MNHIVALSGGKDSTSMALRLRELMPDIDFIYAITPTGDELPEMVDHWNNLSKRLGKPLTVISSGKSLQGLIREKKKLPNWRQRWCTNDLKIKPYAVFLASMAPAISYVGLRADEPERQGGNYMNVPGIEARYPMREWGWTIADVYRYLNEKDICIPKRTDCARCFFQRLDEWQTLLEEYPDIYQDAINDENLTGYTFRSPGRDTWPAGLSELQGEFESGRQIRKHKDSIGELKCMVCRK